MQRLTVGEYNRRVLVGAASMDEALAIVAHSFRSSGWNPVSAKVERPSYPNELKLIEYLRDNQSLTMMYGPRLYVVTIQLTQYVEVPDDWATNDPGLAEQSGVPMAGDSQSSGEGSSDRGFGGPPTEA